MVVPKDTTVMIDGGAIFKLYAANIQVGSSEIGVDLSGVCAAGVGHTLGRGLFHVLPGQHLGKNNNPISTPPKAGNWGGLVFENDLDYSYGRYVAENQGIFLDYVNHADLITAAVRDSSTR